MAVSIKMYSHFPTNLMNGNIVGMGSETAFKCMLCTSSYTPNQDDHNDKADITDEVSGTGYTAGGATMTSTTVSVAGRVTTFDAANTSWSSSTITARYAVIYDSTEAADADKPLVCYVDFGENKSSENGTFQLTWNASGIFTITVAA